MKKLLFLATAAILGATGASAFTIDTNTVYKLKDSATERYVNMDIENNDHGYDNANSHNANLNATPTYVKFEQGSSTDTWAIKSVSGTSKDKYLGALLWNSIRDAESAFYWTVEDATVSDYTGSNSIVTFAQTTTGHPSGGGVGHLGTSSGASDTNMIYCDQLAASCLKFELVPATNPVDLLTLNYETQVYRLKHATAGLYLNLDYTGTAAVGSSTATNLIFERGTDTNYGKWAIKNASTSKYLSASGWTTVNNNDDAAYWTIAMADGSTTNISISQTFISDHQGKLGIDNNNENTTCWSDKTSDNEKNGYPAEWILELADCELTINVTVGSTTVTGKKSFDYGTVLDLSKIGGAESYTVAGATTLELTAPTGAQIVKIASAQGRDADSAIHWFVASTDDKTALHFSDALSTAEQLIYVPGSADNTFYLYSPVSVAFSGQIPNNATANQPFDTTPHLYVKEKQPDFTWAIRNADGNRPSGGYDYWNLRGSSESTMHLASWANGNEVRGSHWFIITDDTQFTANISKFNAGGTVGQGSYSQSVKGAKEKQVAYDALIGDEITALATSITAANAADFGSSNLATIESDLTDKLTAIANNAATIGRNTYLDMTGVAYDAASQVKVPGYVDATSSEGAAFLDAIKVDSPAIADVASTAKAAKATGNKYGVTDGAIYTIKSTEESIRGQLCVLSTGILSNTVNVGTNLHESGSGYYQFAAVVIDDNVYLYNVGAQKFINAFGAANTSWTDCTNGTNFTWQVNDVATPVSMKVYAGTDPGHASTILGGLDPVIADGAGDNLKYGAKGGLTLVNNPHNGTTSHAIVTTGLTGEADGSGVFFAYTGSCLSADALAAAKKIHNDAVAKVTAEIASIPSKANIVNHHTSDTKTAVADAETADHKQHILKSADRVQFVNDNVYVLTNVAGTQAMYCTSDGNVEWKAYSSESEDHRFNWVADIDGTSIVMEHTNDGSEIRGIEGTLSTDGCALGTIKITPAASATMALSDEGESDTDTNVYVARKVSDSKDDATTSIESIAAAEGAEAIYDLQGRRVQHATRGLYIINGRKVIR